MARFGAQASVPRNPERGVATAYNEAGAKYVEYADGSAFRLFDFEGPFAYGDRALWSVIDGKLKSLRTRTVRVSVLDLGCGPGTWLRRIVTRALELGFTEIQARGTDIADGQIRRARGYARRLMERSGVTLDFDVADIRDPLPAGDKSVDLCLCLYTVLNHVPATDLGRVIAEIARVTAGDFITTVRTVGSTPTIFIGPVDSARRFRQDNAADRFEVDMNDGRHASFNSHLFNAAELRALMARDLSVEDIRGLDLFHSRFAADRRWNPPSSVASTAFRAELDRIEDDHCRDPDFMDHATHLLLVAGPKASLG